MFLFQKHNILTSKCYIYIYIETEIRTKSNRTLQNQFVSLIGWPAKLNFLAKPLLQDMHTSL